MNKKITVFGSYVVDLMSRASHLPLPGETVKGNLFKMGPGGKGFNQGVAAYKSGGDMTMVTKLGDDFFGRLALDTMEALGMATDHIFVSQEYQTGTALIMVDEKTSQNAIMVTSGACGHISMEDMSRVADVIASSRYLLLQLETNLEAITEAIRIAASNGVYVVLNPAPVQPIPDSLLQKVDIITPNEVEAQILTGVEIDTGSPALEDQARAAADFFFSKGVSAVIITLGSKGAYVSDQTRSQLIAAPVVSVLDTTGAGDAFNGGLVTALAEGKDIFEAARFACDLAAISVTRMGTAPAMPTRREIEEFRAGTHGEELSMNKKHQ